MMSFPYPSQTTSTPMRQVVVYRHFVSGGTTLTGATGYANTLYYDNWPSPEPTPASSPVTIISSSSELERFHARWDQLSAEMKEWLRKLDELRLRGPYWGIRSVDRFEHAAPLPLRLAAPRPFPVARGPSRGSRRGRLGRRFLQKKTCHRRAKKSSAKKT
jgi:hypothetical protein